MYYKSRVENVPVYMWIYNKFAARDLAIRKRRSIDYDDDEDDDDEAKEGGINWLFFFFFSFSICSVTRFLSVRVHVYNKEEEEGSYRLYIVFVLLLFGYNEDLTNDITATAAIGKTKKIENNKRRGRKEGRNNDWSVGLGHPINARRRRTRRCAILWKWSQWEGEASLQNCGRVVCGVIE